MAKYGQTANGMAHFAPMMKLEAPQLDIGNPFKDYIAKALNLNLVISHTTRAPRKGELQHIHKHFHQVE